MQCSISSPKPKLSWLDRLRSSKGFPVSDGPQSLDHFLSSNLNPNPNPNPSKIPPLKPQPTKNQTLFTLMTDVLSDLFVMCSSRSTTLQKAARKQPNPRNYNGGGVREVSPSSVNNGVESEGRKRKLLKVRKMRGEDGEVMKEGLDLEGFSRTEVTVIDTSLGPEWKASMVLYRKGLVWKAREKKVVGVGRKRRRRVGGSEEKKGVGVRREQMGVLEKVMEKVLFFFFLFVFGGELLNACIVKLW